MSILSSRSAPVPGLAGHLAGRAAAAVLSFVLRPVRAWRRRAELAQLGGLTDIELRDIGLYRHDLRDASALPPDADPTVHLARVVHERQRASRIARLPRG